MKRHGFSKWITCAVLTTFISQLWTFQVGGSASTEGLLINESTENAATHELSSEDLFSAVSSGSTALARAAANGTGEGTVVSIPADDMDSQDYLFNSKYYKKLVATDTVYLYPKGNTITMNTFGPDEEWAGERYITLSKTSADDCHMDITPAKQYPYMVLSGDFKSDGLGANPRLFFIRDGVTQQGKRFDDQIAKISPAGELILKNGTVVKTLEAGQWFNLTAACDLMENTADIYVDGEPVYENLPLNPEIKGLSLVRLWVDAGSNGNLSFANVKIIGLKKPYVHGQENTASIFPGSEAIVSFLQSKTALQGYSGALFAQGEKTALATLPVVEEKDILVSEEALEKGFGLNLIWNETEQTLSDGAIEIKAGTPYVQKENGSVVLDTIPRMINGQLMVPFRNFAEKVLGRFVFDDGFGLLVAGESNETLSEEDAQRVNDYMFYERPSASAIEAKFYEASNNGAVHPRILATSEDFFAINTQALSDERVDAWRADLIAKADSVLLLDPVSYVFSDGVRLLAVSREVLRRMELLGFAYQVTGDQKYVDRAWEDFEAVGLFPDWHENHFIDLAELNAAMGIGYDWMYHGLNQEQRVFIVDAVKRLGLEPTRDGYYGRLTGGIASGSRLFTAFVGNFNTVGNGGAVIAALAIAESDPVYCFDIVEKALRSIEYTFKGFKPEGGWDEGPNYWGYTMSYLSKFVGALDSALGTDFGLMKSQGTDKTGIWALGLESPSGKGLFNFGDTWENTHISSPAFSWLAQKYNTPGYFSTRAAMMASLRESPTVYDLIWYTQDASTGGLTLPLDSKTAGVQTSFSMKGSLVDPDALFVGGKGGQGWSNHSHCDKGSFVFDILGERWAIDLSPEDYNFSALPGNFPKVYRRRTEGHNTLVINPDSTEGQINSSYAPITDFVSKARGGYALVDLSQMYIGVNSVKRGFLVGDDRRSLTIRDELDLMETSDIYWFMHTRAEITLVGNTAILTQNGKSIKLEYVTDALQVQFSVMDASPLPTSPNPAGQTSNAGIKKIAIKLTGQGRINLTVKLSPVGEPAEVSEMNLLPLSQWDIPEGEIEEREDLRLSQIYVDGREIALFDPNQYQYKVLYDQSTGKPEITAQGLSQSARVELLTDENGNTVIKVYDSASLFSRTYTVAYIEIQVPEDVAGYSRYSVVDVVVSSEVEPENNSFNLLDGRLDTRWTGMGIGEWALIDLGSIKDVDAIGIAFWKGNQRAYSFDIMASEDGVSFHKVYQGKSSGLTEDYEILTTQGLRTRFIKYIGYGNPVNIYNNVLELAVLKNKDH